MNLLYLSIMSNNVLKKERQLSRCFSKYYNDTFWQSILKEQTLTEATKVLPNSNSLDFVLTSLGAITDRIRFFFPFFWRTSNVLKNAFLNAT